MLRLAPRRLSTNEAPETLVGAKWKSVSSAAYARAARTVLVFPTPGCPTRNVYKFGCNLLDVINHTFCSKVAATIPIAAHFLKIIGLSRLS